MPIDKTYLMTARTLTTLKRNCLEPMVQLFGAENFQYSISSKQGRLFGRNVQFEGANDAQAEAKIRGLTLQGAYVDEITLVPEDYFTMLLSRLSEKDAKLFGSTNPNSPSHWLKRKYIDRADELSIYYDTYVIDDNTFLDPEYIANIKSEYTGVFYKRFILGMWVIAEGLVYQFDR
jgi:PBSX family phage terminase large subunit